MKKHQIQGWWDDEPAPHLEVTLSSGEKFDVIVDSGYSGTLMLPFRRIERLGLEKYGHTYHRLANGASIRTATYSGEILWFGQKLSLLIQANETDEGLLGTELFQGCKVELDPDANVVSFRKKPARRR